MLHQLPSWAASALRQFIEQFHDALAGELEMHTELPLFRDVKRLQGGDILDSSVSRALCESACMIVVFIPPYFSRTNRYCTREYAAMIDLERERLGQSPQHGLIIPVVLRRFDKMPQELKGRLAYRFDEYSLSDPAVGTDPKYTPQNRQMAEYISARCQDLEDWGSDCGTFALPPADKMDRFLLRLEGPRVEFPGREVSNG